MLSLTLKPSGCLSSGCWSRSISVGSSPLCCLQGALGDKAGCRVSTLYTRVARPSFESTCLARSLATSGTSSGRDKKPERGKCAEHRVPLNSETQRGLGSPRAGDLVLTLGARGRTTVRPLPQAPQACTCYLFTPPGSSGTPCSGDESTFLPLHLVLTAEKVLRGQSRSMSSRPQLSTQGKRVGWDARLRCSWGSPHT